MSIIAGGCMTFNKKNFYGMRLIFLIVFFVGLGVQHVYAKDTCIDCHRDDKFRVQNKVLFDYYNNWKDSTHDLSGVTCTDCHGGDPTKTDKDVAHKDGFSSPRVSGEIFYKKIPQTCGSNKCHGDVLKNFIESKHFKALIKEGKGPHCATCHGSVNTEVYYTSIIARTCEACHNEETKNRPEATKSAEKILQRINVSHGYRNWTLIYYSDKEPVTFKEINALYEDIATSWHSFDFEELDEKSQELLNKLKSIVNRGLAEKKKKRGQK